MLFMLLLSIWNLNRGQVYTVFFCIAGIVALNALEKKFVPSPERTHYSLFDNSVFQNYTVTFMYILSWF